MQQQALGQLQAGLVDELESKGTFKDPETQKIMEKYQKVCLPIHDVSYLMVFSILIVPIVDHLCWCKEKLVPGH